MIDTPQAWLSGVSGQNRFGFKKMENVNHIYSFCNIHKFYWSGASAPDGDSVLSQMMLHIMHLILEACVLRSAHARLCDLSFSMSQVISLIRRIRLPVTPIPPRQEITKYFASIDTVLASGQ